MSLAHTFLIYTLCTKNLFSYFFPVQPSFSMLLTFLQFSLPSRPVLDFIRSSFSFFSLSLIIFFLFFFPFSRKGVHYLCNHFMHIVFFHSFIPTLLLLSFPLSFCFYVVCYYQNNYPPLHSKYGARFHLTSIIWVCVRTFHARAIPENFNISVFFLPFSCIRYTLHMVMLFDNEKGRHFCVFLIFGTALCITLQGYNRFRSSVKGLQ